MANIYSSTRPLHGLGPQTQQFQQLAEYAYAQDTQDLLQRLLADLFQERPADPLAYMQAWLGAEQQRRQERQQGLAAAAAAGRDLAGPEDSS